MWICASTISMRVAPSCRLEASCLLEVDPLVHRQALQVTAQAVEPHLGGAQADPLSPTQDPTAPGFDAVGGRDRQTYGPTEVDPVRPVVEIDEHRQLVGRAGPPARGLRHRLGRLARELARRRIAVDADPGEDLRERA